MSVRDKQYPRGSISIILIKYLVIKLYYQCIMQKCVHHSILFSKCIKFLSNRYLWYVLCQLERRNDIMSDIWNVSIKIESHTKHKASKANMSQEIITHAPVHINDFRGVRARYVKRTGYRSSDRNAQVKGQQPLWHSFVYLNVWHHNGATIATIVATIATTS